MSCASFTSSPTRPLTYYSRHTVLVILGTKEGVARAGFALRLPLLEYTTYLQALLTYFFQVSFKT